MRKLTGYIGAMVIVFALAGSVLLGFVLNVTNDPVIKDDYETITDISGLYTHSQEETYIDYNPASNYIGYNIDQSPPFTIVNTTSTNNLYYSLFTGNISAKWNNTDYSQGAFYLNNNYIYYSKTSDQMGAMTYTIALGDGITIYQYQPDGTTPTMTIEITTGGTTNRYWSWNFDISYDGSVVTIVMNNNNTTVTKQTDYLIMPNNNGGFVAVFNNNVGYYQSYMYSTDPVTISNVDNWDGKPTYNLYSVNTGGSSSKWAFVPKIMNYNPIADLGISFTTSNRVNNYPVTNAYDSVISDIKTLTSSLTQSNYAVDVMMLGNDYYTTFSTPQPDSDNGYEDNGRNYAFYHPYKTTLATILNTITLDAGTTSVTFTNKSGSYITTPAYTGGYSGYGQEYHWGKVSANAVWFVNPDTPTRYTYNSSPTWGYPANCTYINDWTGTYYNTENHTQQLIYDVSRGLVDFYADDVKIGTYSPSDITVLYGGSTIYTNQTTYYRNGQATGSFTTGSYAFSPSITTNLYYTEYTSQPAVYLDPTEGIKIKSSNTQNVNWSNGYRNSDIQILFRIVNQGEDYVNDIIVGNDTVKVSSDGYTFSVQINNDTPVDIGNWRNIILDLDVINGQVKALPVRTFNNFTNVRLYNDTDVYVGQLSDKQTVNSLAFSPTNKSFTFSIYNTKVFMDTYGVVMVDPSINVTDYFTDLDGFYKIKMDKFSLIGNSITINGQTFDIINNKIRIENSDQKITDMDIFYKNGQCSVYFAESDTTISLGNVVTNAISMTGNWYFTSVLYKGSEITDREYTWHIEDFVMNNGQFVVIYLGLLAVCYVAARKFCVFTVTDYLIMIASIIIALGVQIL